MSTRVSRSPALRAQIKAHRQGIDAGRAVRKKIRKAARAARRAGRR